jgi:hypothetical protein
MNTPNFINRNPDSGTESGTIPITALPIGTALMISTVDADTGIKTFILADGRADGFLTRDSRTTPGLTDEEQLFKFGLETPFLAGGAGSIEDGDNIEVEGSDYILLYADDNVNGLRTATAIGTPLSFLAGKWCKAASGQIAQYKLNSVLTPVNDPLALRIYAVSIEGYLVP